MIIYVFISIFIYIHVYIYIYIYIYLLPDFMTFVLIANNLIHSSVRLEGCKYRNNFIVHVDKTCDDV
jgi:hypothetical protein